MLIARIIIKSYQVSEVGINSIQYNNTVQTCPLDILIISIMFIIMHRGEQHVVHAP